MAEFDHLKVHREDRTLWVGINRPEVLNAFNLQTLDEIIRAFRELDENPDLGVGVLYGVGDNFCAGGQMQAMLALDQTTGHVWNNRMRQLCSLLRECGKPTIAMVRGWCVGGGNEWQLYCDLCICSETARFGQSGARVGALPVVGATQYLPLIMGDRRARQMLFLAEYLSANDAQAAGLVNEVVPDADLEEMTRSWCKRINSHAPATLRYMKTSLNYLGDLHYPSWIHGSELLNAVWNNEQSNEGMTAFLEKRPPDFSRFPR
jgi:enoyl-CoA hydratase/carnithine racemase